MQARHLFWVLLRDQVGPLLRAEGFRGSGQSWRLEHPSGNAALIRIQRSRWNTADSVQFTINLAVASKVVWDWQLTREPGRGPAARPSALYANDCPLWRRIGAGLGEDGWWTITSGMVTSTPAAMIVPILALIALFRLPDFVAGVKKAGHQAATDVSGGPGDEHPHGCWPLRNVRHQCSKLISDQSSSRRFSRTSE